MRLRLTSRDFLLLLGIAVATVIVVTTLYYRDMLITSNPQVSKKSKPVLNTKVLVDKAAKVISERVHLK